VLEPVGEVDHAQRQPDALVTLLPGEGGEQERSRFRFWNTNPMCCARQAASCPGVIALTSEPATRMVPLVGRSSPASRLSSVDFPDPEGPMRAVKEPSLMSSERPVKISIRSESR
jgi:hypothetical protein